MDTRDSTLSLMTSGSNDSRDVDLSSISTSSSSESIQNTSRDTFISHLSSVPLTIDYHFL